MYKLENFIKQTGKTTEVSQTEKLIFGQTLTV